MLLSLFTFIMTIFKIIIAGLAVFSLAGCTSYSQNISTPDNGSASREVAANNGAGNSVFSANPITIDLAEYSFSPDHLTLKAGQTAELALTNTGKILHTFTVPDLNVDESLAAGQSKTITVRAAKSGTFELFCSIPGHKERGMRGQVNVQ